MDKNYILINESADEDADYLFFLFKKLYAWIYFSRSNLVDFLYVARVVSPNFSNDQDFHHWTEWIMKETLTLSARRLLMPGFPLFELLLEV